jgi:transposase, IS6 family
MCHCRVRTPPHSSSFAGFRYPPEVILVAVCWYLRYARSYRDVEELLAERGVIVDHVTIYRYLSLGAAVHACADRRSQAVPARRR